MDIGSKIKMLRKENHLNQEQFAEIFHVTRQTVSNWENNKNYPDMSSLKQISDTFQISFDTLLKDDLELMSKIDSTSKKAVRRKYIIVILFFTLCAGFGFFLYFFNKAFEITKDSDRIHTKDNVRMLVNLPDAAPSRAITYSFAIEDRDSKYSEQWDEWQGKVLGRVEGDIPSVFTNETPKIILYFQDAAWNNIVPETIVDLTLDLKNVVSLETQKIKPKYRYDNGNISFELDPEFVKYDKNSLDWYECVVTVRYTIKEKTYLSITGLNIMENRYRGSDL